MDPLLNPDLIINQAVDALKRKKAQTDLDRVAQGEVVNPTAPRPYEERSLAARVLGAPVEALVSSVNKARENVGEQPVEPFGGSETIDQFSRFATTGIVGGFGDTAAFGALARAGKIAYDNYTAEPPAPDEMLLAQSTLDKIDPSQSRGRSYEEAVYQAEKIPERDEYITGLSLEVARKQPELTPEEVQDRVNEYFAMNEEAYDKLSSFMTPEMQFLRNWRKDVHKQAGYAGTPDAFGYMDDAKEIVASSLVALPAGPSQLMGKLASKATKNAVANGVAKAVATAAEVVTPVTIPATGTAVAANMGVQLIGAEAIRSVTGAPAVIGDSEALWEEIAEQGRQQQLQSGVDPETVEQEVNQALFDASPLAMIFGVKAGKANLKAAAKLAQNASPSTLTPPPTGPAPLNPAQFGDAERLTSGQVLKFAVDENAGLAGAVRNATGSDDAAEAAYDVSVNFRGVAGREKDEFATATGVLPGGYRISPDANLAELRRLHNLIDPKSRELAKRSIYAIQELENRRLAKIELDTNYNNAVAELQKKPTSTWKAGNATYDAVVAADKARQKFAQQREVDRIVQGTDADLNRIVQQGFADPRIKEFVTRGEKMLKELLEVLNKEGIVDDDTFKQLKNQRYVIKTWGDPRGSLSWSGKVLDNIKQKLSDSIEPTSPRPEAPTTEGLWKRTLIKDDADKITNGLDPLEQWAGALIDASSAIRRNQVKRSVLEPLIAGKHPQIKKVSTHDMSGFSKDTHVLYHNPKTKKLEAYQMPTALARHLNYEPERLNGLVAIPAFLNRWAQRFTTGGLRDLGGLLTGNLGMVATKKNLWDATWTALATAPKGTSLNPANIAKGLPIAVRVGGQQFRRNFLVGMRNSLLSSSPMYSLIAKYPSGVEKFDQFIEKMVARNMTMWEQVMRELGTTPQGVLGNSYDPAVTIGVLRTKLNSLPEQQGAFRGLLEGYLSLFESVSAFSNYGLLVDQMPKLLKKYGSWDQVPQFEKNKLARWMIELQGGSMIRPGSHEIRTAASVVPYANPTIQGTRVLGKRIGEMANLGELTNYAGTKGLTDFGYKTMRNIFRMTYKTMQDPAQLAKFLGYGVAPRLLSLAVMSTLSGGSYWYWMEQSDHQRMRYMPMPSNPDVLEHFYNTMQAWATGEHPPPERKFNPDDFTMIPAPIDVAPLVDFMMEWGKHSGYLPLQAPKAYDPEATELLTRLAMQYIPAAIPGLAIGAFNLFSDKPVSEEIKGMLNMSEAGIMDSLGASLMVLGSAGIETWKTGAAAVQYGKTAGETLALAKEQLGESLQGRTVLWDHNARVTRSNPLIDGVFKNEAVADKATAVLGFISKEKQGQFDPRLGNPETLKFLVNTADSLHSALKKKGPYKELTEDIGNVRKAINRINGAEFRAKYGAEKRDQAQQTATEDLHKLYNRKRMLLDKYIKYLQGNRGEQFKQMMGEDLTYESLEKAFDMVLRNQVPE
jgi:hypothetical protein